MRGRASRKKNVAHHGPTDRSQLKSAFYKGNSFVENFKPPWRKFSAAKSRVTVAIGLPFVPPKRSRSASAAPVRQFCLPSFAGEADRVRLANLPDKKPIEREEESKISPGTIRALFASMHFECDPSDSELFKAQLNGRAKQAENRLLLAVLESAVEDLHKYASAKNGKRRLLYEEAREWIQERNPEWFLSFDSICETLCLSSDQLRRQLLGCRIKNNKAA